MALSAGTRLGPYEILARLAAGGMGEVYRARDPRLKREVALKVLASEPERLERFEREAQTLAAPNHPHIVTIHSVEEAEGLRFRTMELVEGKTVTRVIPRSGLPLPRFFRIAIPLSEAVSAAHEKGITHRDLKPGNVKSRICRSRPPSIDCSSIGSGHAAFPRSAPRLTPGGPAVFTFANSVKIVAALMGLMLIMLGMMAAMMINNNARATRGSAAFAAKNANLIPKFTELDSGFSHIFRGHNSQPVMDMVLFDPRGDGTQAIMVTGGQGQADAVLAYKDGKMRDIAGELGLHGIVDDPSYCLAADDIDGDGLQEVIVGRQSGIYIYSRTKGDPVFRETKVDMDLPPDATPAGVATSDATKSGLPDLFISTFIDHSKHSTANFNDPGKRVANVFWRNNGDGTFRDASKESGLDLHHNTFLAVFVDLNGNGFEDIVLATNTAEGYVYENLGDGTFKQHKLPIGYGFWMGIGVSDVTRNGFPDIYLANTGTAVPSFMMKGDLTSDQKLDTSYRLLANDGSFNFEDVTEKFGLASPGFGWGMLFADFTNNAVDEIVITENFIGMPMNIQKYLPSKGSLYVRGPDGKYVNTVIPSRVVNKNFGYRALAADLNGSGFKDLIIGNIDGPVRIFLNDGTPKG